MQKCSLYIAEPPGIDVGGVMGFFGALLPEYLPEGFEFYLTPWQDKNVSFCLKVTKVEFTIIGELNYVSEENTLTIVFVEPNMLKTTATPAQWKEFSETAAT